MADLTNVVMIFSHIMFAIYMIGGAFFFEMIVKKELMTLLNPMDAGKVTMSAGKKFTKLALLSWAIIIVSGLYMAFVMDGATLDSMINTAIGNVLLVKILLALVAFVLGLYNINLSMKFMQLAPQLKMKTAKTMTMISRVQIVLGIVIVFVAVYLANFY